MAVASVITAFNWVQLGGNIIKFLGNGIKGMGGTLSNCIKNCFDQGLTYIKSLPGKAAGWAADMINGFVEGIFSSMHKVADAVKNVASTITAYMHFSRPDLGPLRQYEQWMPDFMAGLSRGITDNLWMVEDAAEMLSGATAVPMQLAVAGTLRSNRFGGTADTWQPGGMTVNLNNEFHTHDSLSESELTREAESMAQRLKWAIP